MNEYRNLRSVFCDWDWQCWDHVTYLLVVEGGKVHQNPHRQLPPEYADKHMPDGYWNNPDIIAEGKAIYTGQHNIDVNCASCHGKNGKPVKAGARDFRRTEQMETLFRFGVVLAREVKALKAPK